MITIFKSSNVSVFIKAVLLVFAFGIGKSAAYAQTENYPYKIKYLTVDEGLSHTDANDITQDHKGFIWIATYFGLDRFDGYAVKKFYNSNEPLKNAYKNRVRCIYADNNNGIWLGTEGGLQRFDAQTERYADYHCQTQSLNNFEKLYSPYPNKVYCLLGNQLKVFKIKGTSLTEKILRIPSGLSFSDFIADEKGNLYLATNKGLWKIDQKDRFKKLNITGFSDQNIDHIAFGAKHELIFTVSDQIYVTNQVVDGADIFKLVHYAQSPFHHFIKNFAADQKDNYWVNDGYSIFRLDQSLNLIQLINNKGLQQSLNSNSATKVFIDRSQCAWICTFGGGVNYFDLNEKPFYTLQHNPGISNSLSGNYVRSVLADGDNLWLGTTDNGLNCYNLQTHLFKYYNTYNSAVRLKNDGVTSLVFDNNHNLWIGSMTGIEILDVARQKIIKPLGVASFPNYSIEVLTKDCFGNIWFGNHTDRFGVIIKDEHGIYHTKYYGEGFFILADTVKPQLLVSSTHGLKQIAVDKGGNITREYTFRATGKGNSLSSDYTYPIVKQNDSTFWVGTIGGGLNRLTLRKDHTHIIEVFDSRYGIFNDVESMEIDNAGNIWMGGNGLECFNPVTHSLIRYDKNDGLQGNSFKVGSSYKGADGRLYFGGINGLNFFNPDEITINNIPARPTITDILINNEHPAIDDHQHDNTITRSVGYSPFLKINYLQNNFVISFSAMQFANPLKCKYRYKLIGFDNEWKYTDGKNPSAAYNNVDYATYKFVVEATNDDGIWAGSAAKITISITPPWWKSTLAKIIYLLILLSILLSIYLYQNRWHMLKRDIEIGKVNEKKQQEIHLQREELHQQQLMFFTNISHEFRTPLTLILGPLEHLIHQNKDIHLDSSYQLILRNAKRLMNLITELMNFKKVADSIIKLQVRLLDIYQFCADIGSDFENIALSKDISFNLVNNTGQIHRGSLVGYVDVQVLEKILFNLLNNSFKYTEDNGQITLELFSDLTNFKPSFKNEYKLLNEYRADRYIYIRIADTGIGISADSIENIFDRYYRISRSHLGSGVGLALVKSLTQLHKGDIYVYSERLKGTEIIIGIPWGEHHYQEAEKAAGGTEVSYQLEPIDKSLLIPATNSFTTMRGTNEKDGKRILIVEDNEELRRFLKQVLEKDYQIYEAEDGLKGFELATEKVPDVIISDVMMPKMTGIELCKMVKQKFETRHIPFIILSAKDALDTKIEGMESGADFYFSKPLSVDLLTLTVKNIFERREVLKQRFLTDYLSNATELVQTEVDKEFFDKLISIIESNMEDVDLDVDFLCKHLFVSRTKLYQKIKSISGQSVGEFIRTIRLKKSVEIMTHENVSMNEVADRIGMQSSSNFSRAFKKEYGKSPLQFMQSLKRSNNV